jgi:hypothetical protein
MAKNDDADLRLIAKHLVPGAGGTSLRSPLFRWMFKQSVPFQRLLDDTRPSWKSVADGLAALDLRDGDGKHPNAIRARKTWCEVKKAKAKAANRRLPLLETDAAPALLTPRSQPAPMTASSPASARLPVTREEDFDDEPPAYDFKRAKPR